MDGYYFYILRRHQEHGFFMLNRVIMVRRVVDDIGEAIGWQMLRRCWRCDRPVAAGSVWP
jgi:hypothetical protein